MTNRRGGPNILPFDYLVIGYSLAMLLVVAALGRPLARYYDELILYAALPTLATLIIFYTREDGPWLSRFLRLCYPALMFAAFYRLTGGTMFLLFDSFYDWQITAFEKNLFGVNPTLYIDQHLLNVWLNEIFMAAYFAYYPMIPVTVITLFVKRRYDALKQLITAICLTFFASYPLFFLYPIEGPRWHYADIFTRTVDGPVFRQLVNFVIDNGAVRGGCVPSTHVAVSLVITLFAFRYYRNWRWPLTAITIGMAISTFWGRFHYVSDVFIGLAIALIGTLIVWKYWEKWTGKKTGYEQVS